jgi:hypothetical protein
MTASYTLRNQNDYFPLNVFIVSQKINSFVKKKLNFMKFCNMMEFTMEISRRE